MYLEMSEANLFLLALIAASFAVTSAASDAEIAAIKEYAMPLIASCNEEFGVTKEDIKAVKKSKSTDGIDPCYVACFFKKVGVINDNGLLDVESVNEKHDKLLSSEEDRKRVHGIVRTCSSVNDATVSDGDKGCERAKLLLTCLIKEKFPFIFGGEI